MYHLLNKKKYGIINYFAAFMIILFSPFVNAMHITEGEGGSDKDEPELTKEEKEQQDKLLNLITGKITEIVTDATKENVKKEDVDKKVAEVNKLVTQLRDEAINDLKERVDKMAKENEALTKASKDQGVELTKLKNQKQSGPVVSFIEATKNAILGHPKKDEYFKEVTDSYGTRTSLLDFFKNGGQRTPEFEIDGGSDIIRNKAAVEMLESNIVQANVSTIRLTDLVPGTYGVPLTLYAHVLDYFPIRNISRPNLAMLVVYSYEDGVDTTAEGAASSKSSFLLKTVSFPAFYVDTHIPLSEETLDDLDEVLSEINRIAPSKVKEKLDEKVYADAGNDSTDIKGMFVNGDKCTDFDTTDYADSIPGANWVDVIECMIAECESNNYVPDTVGFNPTDVRLKFNSLKNQLDDSIRDNRLVFTNGVLVSVCGLTVRRSAKITANSCFVGAIQPVALLGVRKNMALEFGYNSTDFTERQITARIGLRVAFGVGDPLAIQYCADVATALAAIEDTGA